MKTHHETRRRRRRQHAVLATALLAALSAAVVTGAGIDPGLSAHLVCFEQAAQLAKSTTAGS